jgi:hypothetical protein
MLAKIAKRFTPVVALGAARKSRASAVMWGAFRASGPLLGCASRPTTPVVALQAAVGWCMSGPGDRVGPHAGVQARSGSSMQPNRSSSDRLSYSRECQPSLCPSLLRRPCSADSGKLGRLFNRASVARRGCALSEPTTVHHTFAMTRSAPMCYAKTDRAGSLGGGRRASVCRQAPVLSGALAGVHVRFCGCRRHAEAFRPGAARVDWSR